MKFWFSKKKEIPSWSPFAKDKDFYFFMDQIARFFEPYNTRTDLESGQVVKADSLSGIDEIFVLYNAAVLCADAEHQEYEEIISKKFSPLLNGTAFDSKEERMLAARILPKYIFEQMNSENFVGFDVAEGLFCYLVYDTSQGAVNATKEELSQLNKSEAELMKLGRANVRNKYPFMIEPYSGNIFIVGSEYYYAPNIMIELGDYPNLIGKFGSIISPSNGHLVTVALIEDDSIFDELLKVAQLADFARENFENRVSQDLYWYKPNGEFSKISINAEDGIMALPGELVNMLRELAE